MKRRTSPTRSSLRGDLGDLATKHVKRDPKGSSHVTINDSGVRFCGPRSLGGLRLLRWLLLQPRWVLAQRRLLGSSHGLRNRNGRRPRGSALWWHISGDVVKKQYNYNML